MTDKKTYAEKLRDPRWQKMRLEILQRDNWTCQKCKDKETELQIHHKYYIGWKDPWDCDPKTLITLCKDCHEEEEGCKDLQKSIVNTLLDAGFFNKDFDYFSAIISSAYEKMGKDPLDSLLLTLAMDDKFSQALIEFHARYCKENQAPTSDPHDDLF